MTDPIADMLTQIRNALAVKKPLISIPHSNFKHNLAELLSKGGYVGSVVKVGKSPIKYLKIELKYDENSKPVVEELKKVSKPGQRIYLPKSKIKSVKSGMGRLVVSTSKGLMFDSDARKEGLGGEIICEVF